MSEIHPSLTIHLVEKGCSLIRLNARLCVLNIYIERVKQTYFIYSLGGQFRSVENTKDQGVTISSDLP